MVDCRRRFFQLTELEEADSLMGLAVSDRGRFLRNAKLR